MTDIGDMAGMPNIAGLDAGFVRAAPTLAELNGVARKPGRQKGGSNAHSRQWTSLALAFRANGLDWRADFAEAIKKKNFKRMQFWLRLLPYMLTGKRTQHIVKGKGRISRQAMAKLKELEGR